MPAPAKSRTRRLGWVLEALALLALAALACWGTPSKFPPEPPAAQQTPDGAVRAYALGRKSPPDYFTVQNAAGRIFRIGYDSGGDGKPGQFVNLDEIPLSESIHFVLVLDGIPYSVADAYQRKGGLRLFHPPSRVVSVYPAFTALALADAFADAPCTAFEAIHYDHRLNKVVGGDLDYLSLANEVWARNCDYRMATLWDPFAYLVPEKVFQKEVREVRDLLGRKDRGVLVAYLVSTAGVATREGEAGIVGVLDEADRLCEELVWRTRGRAKITIFSDHGHTMTPCKRIDFRPFLAGKGWRLSDRLDGPRDVVLVEYGLVTTALFAAKDRAGLAADLAACQGVRFASYPDGAAVAVRAAGGFAVVERKGDSYRYVAAQGDPLGLLPVFAKLKAEGKLDADGFAADRPLFEATALHMYPDACDRLWRAFHGLAEETPDVIADLDWGWFAGSESLAKMLPGVASTHGDLERTSSTAAFMSTLGPVPPVFRNRDVPAVMQSLTGEPWPPVREGAGAPAAPPRENVGR
jgi:hypothetical protein